MRRLRPTGITSIAVFVLLAATAAGTAIAYFTTTGAGSSSAKTVSALGQPAIATATPGVGGTVALSWGAVTPPGTGTGPVTYKVERNGGGASGSCAAVLSATSCVDSGLSAGTYTYVVTARWRSWTVSSASKAATVAVGPADRLVLSAASATPTAGAADNLTITAKDANGGTVTTYAGPKNLTFSGASAGPDGTAPTVADASGTEIAFGVSTAINFSAGVATVSGVQNGVMKLYKSGPASVEVGDGSIATITPLAVVVSAAALTAATTTPAVGATDNLTVTARDAYGNLASSYTGSKSLTFSGASASPSGKTPTVTNSSGGEINFGSTTAIGFTAGVATASAGNNGGMKLYKSGAAAIAVTSGAITTKTPLEVTVSPSTAVKFALTAATATPTAGAVDDLTTTAQDEYGNVATSYTGSKSLTFTGATAGPDGSVPTISDSSGVDVVFGTPTVIDFSAGVATVLAGKNGAMKLYKSGSTSLKVSDGTLLTPTALVVTVAGAAAVKFTLAASVTNLSAGGSANLTTTALDAYGNTATAYAGSKNLTFSGASAIGANKPTVANSSGTATAFGTATAITFTAGVAATTSSTKNGVMKLYAAEDGSIGVSDGSIANPVPLTVTVTPAAASKLVPSAATITPAAGAADNLTTTAQDTYGNTATSYAGSKSLTFSGALAGPDGTVPTVSDSSGADVAFGTATTIDFSAGVATVSAGKNGAMKLYKAGSTTIKASDGTFTTATVTLTVATTASKFLLAAATTTPVAAVATILTIAAKDAYENTVTTYTGTKNLTFSGASASPSGALPTVANSSSSAVNFGSATAIAFTSGVATATSTKNGAMKLNRAGAASITVSDGAISNPVPLAVTVSPAAAARWGLTNISVSAGTLGPTCLFTCTLTALGNSGTVSAKIAVTDSVGNTVSAVGSGHAAKVTTNGTGTIVGTPLAIPSTGAAESATTFTFTARSSGSFTELLTVAASEGTAYTTATLTANK
jgi:hypothetical protein